MTLPTILDTTVAILDEGGPDLLTFRRLAQDLGVGVASLYWHVESRDVLLDLALDQVLAEVRTDGRTVGGTDRDWTGKVRRVGADMYAMFVRHRWAAAQMILSSDRGPNTLRLWEFIGAVFLDAGFSVQQGFDGLSLIMNHVLASGVQEAAWLDSATTTEAQRRARRRDQADFLSSLDPDVYPAIVASADIFANHDQAQQFADGLDLIIAGLGQQLAG